MTVPNERRGYSNSRGSRPHGLASTLTAAIGAPPGLPVTEAVLSKLSPVLLEEDRRLAEEDTRQLHAQLSLQNAALRGLLRMGHVPGSPAGSRSPLGSGSRADSPPPGTWTPPGTWAGPPSLVAAARPPAAPSGGNSEAAPSPPLGMGSHADSPPPRTWMPPGTWAGPPLPRARRPSAALSGSDSENGTPRSAKPAGESSTTGSFTSSRRSRLGSEQSSRISTGSEQSSAKDDPCKATQTTLMMRGIPTNCTRDMLLRLLDEHGFAKCYNLVYVPIDFRSQSGFGYAFVDLVSMAEAERCMESFQGFRDWEVTSDTACEVIWSAARQGLQANVARFRNSPVMHESVPDRFRPALFLDGVQIPFPLATKQPRAPEICGLSQA